MLGPDRSVISGFYCITDVDYNGFIFQSQTTEIMEKSFTLRVYVPVLFLPPLYTWRDLPHLFTRIFLPYPYNFTLPVYLCIV